MGRQRGVPAVLATLALLACGVDSTEPTISGIEPQFVEIELFSTSAYVWQNGTNDPFLARASTHVRPAASMFTFGFDAYDDYGNHTSGYGASGPGTLGAAPWHTGLSTLTSCETPMDGVGVDVDAGVLFPDGDSFGGWATGRALCPTSDCDWAFENEECEWRTPGPHTGGANTFSPPENLSQLCEWLNLQTGFYRIYIDNHFVETIYCP